MINKLDYWDWILYTVGKIIQDKEKFQKIDVSLDTLRLLLNGGVEFWHVPRCHWNF